MSKDLEVVEVDQTRVDNIIWRHLGVKPVREIAEMAGVKPDEVLRRKNELLEDIDVLTIAEKRSQLMVKLQEIAAQTQEDYENSPWEFKAGLMNSSIASMKMILSELSRAERADDSKVEALNQKRIQELVSLIKEVVDVSVREISEKYELDDTELFDVFNARMIEAAQRRDL